MTYAEALDYLYNLVDYSKQRTMRYTAEVLDLSRVHHLLSLLGDPHRSYPSIHIAGTKGKGSVAAMSASVLEAARMRVGLYTSPHLHDFRERIQINRRLIAEPELAGLVERIRPAVAEVPGLTFFDVTTAAAFLYFAEESVDIAVIEVGLGGRLDSTNVINSLVSVITSLSYDHMHILGHTLAEIAAEKAGIIKPGVPVVSAPQVPEALAVIERIAAERDAPLTLIGRDYTVRPGRATLAGQSFGLRMGEWPERRFRIPLLGRHQLTNAAVAVAALDEVRQMGVAIPEQAIVQGLATVTWPGRLEVLSRQPLVIVDSAHNADSVEKLLAALDEWFPGRSRTLIFGAMADKDIDGMIRLLAPAVDRAILTEAEHPRAANPTELAEQMAKFGRLAETAPNPAEALARALAAVQPDGLILATGSLAIVAEVREAWMQRRGEPLSFVRSVGEAVEVG